MRARVVPPYPSFTDAVPQLGDSFHETPAEVRGLSWRWCAHETRTSPLLEVQQYLFMVRRGRGPLPIREI